MAFPTAVSIVITSIVAWMIVVVGVPLACESIGSIESVDPKLRIGPDRWMSLATLRGVAVRLTPTRKVPYFPFSTSQSGSRSRSSSTNEDNFRLSLSPRGIRSGDPDLGPERVDDTGSRVIFFSLHHREKETTYYCSQLCRLLAHVFLVGHHSLSALDHSVPKSTL